MASVSAVAAGGAGPQRGTLAEDRRVRRRSRSEPIITHSRREGYALSRDRSPIAGRLRLEPFQDIRPSRWHRPASPPVISASSISGPTRPATARCTPSAPRPGETSSTTPAPGSLGVDVAFGAGGPGGAGGDRKRAAWRRSISPTWPWPCKAPYLLGERRCGSGCRGHGPEDRGERRSC